MPNYRAKAEHAIARLLRSKERSQHSHRRAAARRIKPGNNRHPITGCRADTLMGLWYMDAAKLNQLRKVAMSVDLMELKKARMEAPAAPAPSTAKAPYRTVGRTAVIG